MYDYSHITNNKFVSTCPGKPSAPPPKKSAFYVSFSRTTQKSIGTRFERGHEARGHILTEWMTTRELRLLGVTRLQLVADAVEQLHIALLGVLFEGRDEGPRHGARCLGGDGCISTGRRLS